ncbi:MAG: TetR/AcrR family transcriptional regulator [Gammaproteobacteria bacterium]|nr:TetR/AcrR family transcriptional regulator [Gammaproteobacteria bacterium]
MAETAKSKLIKAMQSLIRSGDYPDATVEEIASAAGVTKTVFKKTFDTKEVLGVAAIEELYRRRTEMIYSGPHMETVDPIKRIFRYLKHVESQAKQIYGYGSLLGIVAMDASDASPAIRDSLRSLFEAAISDSAEIFAPGLMEVGITMPTAENLAEQFLATLEGSILLALLNNDWRHIATAVSQFREYVKQLLR